jgi:hypothetical protein
MLPSHGIRLSWHLEALVAMQIAEAGANRLLSLGSPRCESDVLARSPRFALEPWKDRRPIAPESPATAVRVGCSVSEIPLIGLTKIKKRKYSPTCVQVGGQAGLFHHGHITGKNRLRRTDSWREFPHRARAQISDPKLEQPVPLPALPCSRGRGFEAAITLNTGQFAAGVTARRNEQPGVSRLARAVGKR